MPMSLNGLAKLVEEIGELQIELGQFQQVIGKKLARGECDDHWDGRGELGRRLEDEMADVKGSIDFAIDKLTLDSHRIEVRSFEKYTKFKAWDSEPL